MSCKALKEKLDVVQTKESGESVTGERVYLAMHSASRASIPPMLGVQREHLSFSSSFNQSKDSYILLAPVFLSTVSEMHQQFRSRPAIQSILFNTKQQMTSTMKRTRQCTPCT
eukprot:2121109-Amphidinium_carterae.1